MLILIKSGYVQNSFERLGLHLIVLNENDNCRIEVKKQGLF
jgi:hypothetical protein